MDSAQTATALLTEHLQYTPLSLIDDVIDSVNNFVYQGVGSLETGLFATPPERLGFKALARNDESNVQSEPEYPEAKQEIEEGLHKLETLLNSTVDKNFDKFEIYVLRNVMSIPDELVHWVRLSHYEGIEYPLPSDAPTIDMINSLRQKLAASRKVNKVLLTEQRRNEVILAQLRSMVGTVVETSQKPNYSFLGSTAAMQAFGSQSQQPLTTNATFTLSQLPTMRSVLNELRGQLALLRSTPTTSHTAKHEVREERREYIEQRTQSHLQRTGQMSGTQGNIGAKAVDPTELEALEKVAATFDHT